MVEIDVMTSPRLSYSIAGDGLSAHVSVIAGEPVQSADFDASIASAGIVAGIISATYDRLVAGLREPNFLCQAELLAQGVAPGQTRDQELELTFHVGPQAGRVREDGSLDYHDHELLKSVKKGDMLGRLHPPVLGGDGQRVDGTVVPAIKPRVITLQLLSGVELDAEMSIRASRDGVVLYRPGATLDVVDRHVHQGSVDRHSGNLNMQGSLAIRGDILRPFSVAATGDVEVHGNVDSASIRAGGQVHVSGGIRGGDGGAICAEGDMTLHHAEAAELHSGGRIQLREAINSRATAAELNATGRWRGGSVVAERRIIIQEAGAPNGIETRLAVGEPLELPVSEAQRLIATVKAERAAARLGGRSDDRSKGGKAGRLRTDLDSQEIRRLAERAKRREQLLASAHIEITLAHPGVKIRIGDAQVILDEPVRSARYSLDGEHLTIRSEKAQ